MKVFRIVLKLVIFVVGLIAINTFLWYALVPAYGSYGQKWKTYATKKNINTLFVGNSVCRAAFDTGIIDEELGTVSFNLGTDGQDLNMSLLAIKTASREHELKTVVLGMNPYTMVAAFSGAPTIAYQIYRFEVTDGMINKVLSTWDYATCAYWANTSESINVLFPWTTYHVPYHFGDIKSNILNKIKGNVISAEDDEKVDRDEIVHADGFGVESINARTEYGAGEYSGKCLQMLAEICKYCKKNDIDLILVNTPRPAYDIVGYGEEYYSNHELIEKICAEYGFEYYDFNFVSDELFDTFNNDYYYDYEHLNGYGAAAFSEAFASFMEMRSEGIDVTGFFDEEKFR